MNTTEQDLQLAANVKELALILKGLAEDAPHELAEVARRLREGKLSGHDLLRVQAVASDYHEKVAGYVAAGVDPAAMAAAMARALCEGSPHGLGPDPERKFGADEVGEAIAALKKKGLQKARVDALPKGMSVRELLEKDFQPPSWIVENLLTTGVTIFAGAPKLGKSWMALGLGSAVGSGGAFLGSYRVERRRSLYLALEDVPRRLKTRLEKIGASLDSNLTIFTEWRSGAEGLADLDAWLYENPGTQLVLIDTLARFRGKPEAGESLYDYDYRITAAVKALADKHDCAIVLIHHVRKMASEDVMETVSGSNGLNGAADTTWILTRARGEADATLFVTGRDIEEQSLALRFDPEIGTWTALGNASDIETSKERGDILRELGGGRQLKTGELAKTLGKSPQAISNRLRDLEAAGKVHSPAYGVWALEGRVSRVSVKVKVPSKDEDTRLHDLHGLSEIVDVEAKEVPLEIW